MFTRPVQKILYELSTRLRIWANWIENKASQIRSDPAAEGSSGPPSGADAPLAGQPPVGWLADTETQPPANWLERIRRASGGQGIEIHAVAQPLPRSQNSAPLPTRPAGPAADLGDETTTARPLGIPAPKQPPAYASPTPGAVLAVPPGVARPVLRLAVFPGPAASRHAAPPQDIPMPEGESTEPARPAPVQTAGDRPLSARPAPVQTAEDRPLPDRPAPVQTAGDRPLPARLSPADRASAPPQVEISQAAPDPQSIPAPLARNWPIFSVPSALPVPANSLASRAAQPENRLYPSPGPAGLPRWPDLPPNFPVVQPAAPEPAQRDSPHRPDFPPDFPPIHPPVYPPASELPQRDIPHRPSGSWPELPLSLPGRWPDLPILPPEDDDQDRYGDLQQQLEHRQRIDQEQRGGPWNT